MALVFGGWNSALRLSPIAGAVLTGGRGAPQPCGFLRPFMCIHIHASRGRGRAVDAAQMGTNTKTKKEDQRLLQTPQVQAQAGSVLSQKRRIYNKRGGAPRFFSARYVVCTSSRCTYGHGPCPCAWPFSRRHPGTQKNQYTLVFSNSPQTRNIRNTKRITHYRSVLG